MSDKTLPLTQAIRGVERRLGMRRSSATREAEMLMGCLRRLVEGRTPDEIHRAFGAPGDFGYETEIGDALSRLYRGEPDAPSSGAAKEGG